MITQHLSNSNRQHHVAKWDITFKWRSGTQMQDSQPVIGQCDVTNSFPNNSITHSITARRVTVPHQLLEPPLPSTSALIPDHFDDRLANCLRGADVPPSAPGPQPVLGAARQPGPRTASGRGSMVIEARRSPPESGKHRVACYVSRMAEWPRPGPGAVTVPAEC